jgi:hypothetical protein
MARGAGSVNSLGERVGAYGHPLIDTDAICVTTRVKAGRRACADQAMLTRECSAEGGLHRGVGVAGVTMALIGVALSCSSSPDGAAVTTLLDTRSSTATTALEQCLVTTGDDRTIAAPPREDFGEVGGDRDRLFGNGDLWVQLKAPGSSLTPKKDGSYSLKFMWWRMNDIAAESLALSGRRLDTVAPPALGIVPGGYGPVFQASGVRFPTAGCWEVTGQAGSARLSSVVEIP